MSLASHSVALSNRPARGVERIGQPFTRPKLGDPRAELVQAIGCQGEGDCPHPAGQALVPELARSQGPGHNDPIHLGVLGLREALHEALAAKRSREG